MPSGRYLFTSESVTEGHPDKIADQISDAILDGIFQQDPYGRVACETLVTTAYLIPTTLHTTLKIYDLLGREIVTLVDGMVSPGEYSVEWDGSDISSGIYIYKLQSGDYSEAKKMLLIR